MKDLRSFCLLIALTTHPAGEARALEISFVSVIGLDPLEVRSEFEPKGASTLAVRLSGQLPQGLEMLRVVGIEAPMRSETHVSARSYDVLAVAYEDLAAWDLSPRKDEIVVVIPDAILFSTDQLEAGLYGRWNQPLISPSYLTLRPDSISANVFPRAGSWLPKLLGILDRILGLHGILRDGDEQSTLFSFELNDQLKPASPLVAIDANGVAEGLAVSSSGDRLCWVSANGELRELWLLEQGRGRPAFLGSHSSRIVGPRFASETVIVYLSNGALFLLPLDDPAGMSRFSLPPLAVSVIHDSAVSNGWLDLVISGVWRAEPAPSRPRPMHLRVDLTTRETTIRRLPVHEYYPFLALAPLEHRLYFVGRFGGKDGVHVLSLDSASISRVFDCKNANQLHQSRNGRRIVFTAAECQ